MGLSLTTPLCPYTTRLMLLSLMVAHTLFRCSSSGRFSLGSPTANYELPKVSIDSLVKNLRLFVAADELRGLATRLLRKAAQSHIRDEGHHHRKPRSSPFFFALRMSSPRNFDGAPTHVQYSVITCECSAITCVPRSGPGEKRMRRRAGETGGQWFFSLIKVETTPTCAFVLKR